MQNQHNKDSKLVNCPSCNNECSKLASSCPKCGQPFVQKNNVLEKALISKNKQSSKIIEKISNVTGWLGSILLFVSGWITVIAWHKITDGVTVYYDETFFRNFPISAYTIFIISIVSFILLLNNKKQLLLYTGLSALVIIVIAYIGSQYYRHLAQDFMSSKYFIDDLIKYEAIENGFNAWKVLFPGAILLLITAILNNSKTIKIINKIRYSEI